MNRIKVYDVVSEYAVTGEDGQKLYNEIHPLLVQNQLIELDFSNVKIYSSQFFNFAFGQLLKDVSADVINEIEFTNITDDGWSVLEFIMSRAKKYYEQQNQA